MYIHNHRNIKDFELNCVPGSKCLLPITLSIQDRRRTSRKKKLICLFIGSVKRCITEISKNSVN